MAKKYSLVAFFLFIFFPLFAFGATLSISPASGSYAVGDRVAVNVVVSSSSSLNAISGIVSVSPSMFAIESVLKAGSVLNFWVAEPSFSNTSGTITFEGVALNGFQGSGGTVVTIVMRALKPGAGSISLKSGQILANDGQGTDITGSLSGATFAIAEAKAAPVTEAPKEPVKKPSGETKPAPAVVVKEEPQAPPTLNLPEIRLGTKYGEKAILGTSEYPEAEVLLTFVSESGTKIFITGESDENGDFTLVVPNSLRRGEYSVTAVMIKEDKTHSFPSAEITVPVGDILSDIGMEARIAFLLLILALVYLLLRGGAHYRKGRNPSLKKEIREAEVVLHKAFDILRDDLQAESRGRMSAAERARVMTLKKDLSDAEDVIDKEIGDIDKNMR